MTHIINISGWYVTSSVKKANFKRFSLLHKIVHIRLNTDSMKKRHNAH
jgi:hypothetical protein